LALIVLATVILQVSFFSKLSILGAAPEILPVVVICLGLLGGALVGATCGFAAGLLIDSLLLQTLGVSSLALLLAGYLAGRYREGFEITNSLVPVLLVGGLTVAYAATYAGIQLMLGVETPVSLLVLREIVVKGLLGMLLALGVYPLLRLCLRSALVDSRPSRGRVPQPASGSSGRGRRPRSRRTPMRSRRVRRRVTA
jgi:rod shape-determining protein MreD